MNVCAIGVVDGGDCKESPRPGDGPYIGAQNVRQAKKHETIAVTSLWEMSRADGEVILRRINLFVKGWLIDEVGD
jgi:hypothetical protein